MNGANTQSRVYDLVGVGFGPSNLALATAVHEHNETAAERIDAVFLESKPQFGWHPGMLLPGSAMQISFAKDLATLRDPRSAFTFFNYLHERGRIVDFVNLQTFFPSRREFSDYLQWAADRVAVEVRYATTAVRVDCGEDRVTVTCEGPQGVSTVVAKNVVLGPGLAAVLPEGIAPGPRVFHNHNLLNELGQVPSHPHGRFAVVGAGQSAGEVLRYLHTSYPEAEVHSIFSKFGFTPSDDSPYANRVFDPDTVDRWFGASESVRERMLSYHRSTNYSAVDIELISDLYQREYEESVAQRRRLYVHNASEIERVVEGSDGVTIDLVDLMDRKQTALHVDAVVYATGFRAFDVTSILEFDGAPGASVRPEVGRDYRLLLPDGYECGAYVNGGVEDSHGLSSSLLSIVAVRAADILGSIRTHARAVVG
ncbi:lysine N(6)-hydroxylase/L-ornithine N(5)-oxygenase family protein [Nocardia callitridis]|uniref:lysine N(6)-hydroxylase/L-ornithine N(5)-oxygenase family protein n=1 Tax=Nocardia callitridis TaxID=648753 RepID=UPI0031E6E3B4